MTPPPLTPWSLFDLFKTHWTLLFATDVAQDHQFNLILIWKWETAIKLQTERVLNL